MDEEKSMLWQNPILTRSCLDWRVLLSSKSILSYISVSSRSSRIALWRAGGGVEGKKKYIYNTIVLYCVMIPGGIGNRIPLGI